ncbi:hypothetical protein RJ641_019725 [Dillenia turbinata]|uniref:Uncharacterized protein n=1 Tax=Dillenia turbinata TaxID=194707 RepID=A0AAN8UQR1_9MAGN
MVEVQQIKKRVVNAPSKRKGRGFTGKRLELESSRKGKGGDGASESKGRGIVPSEPKAFSE